MATANDIVKGALRKLGVKASSQPLTAAEGADGLAALNDLIDSWANERLMLYSITQVSKALTSGVGTYTIGAAASINTTRPVTIESAFVRDASGYDSEVVIISDAQYSLISGKSEPSTRPKYLYYRPSYPLGVVNLYPLPSSGLTLYLNVWSQFSSFATLATDVALPPGYKRALEWNLAMEISPEYREPNPIIIQTAKESKAWIKTVNSKETPVLRSPIDFLGGGGFDIEIGE